MNELYEIQDGEPMISAKGMAVLFGLPLDEIHEASRRAGTSEQFLIPADWMRRGRLRAKEAQAATGETDMLSGLKYWFNKEGVR